MRFLVDECTGPGVARWLRDECGHDVLSIYDDAPGIQDEAVIARSIAERRVIITNDRDFGEMIFKERRPHHGVVFLRLRDERTRSKVEALRSLLRGYADQLEGAFVVVSETHVRFGSS